METMTILTWVGTVASLGGAGVSLWQSLKSRSAAEEAERIRSQLIDHRKAVELAQVQATCRKAQKSMEKYGPGSVPSSLAGIISQEKDAGDVQEFIVVLREHREHFGARQPNVVDQFCKTLTPVLNAFAQATDHVLWREHGSQIVIHLSSIAADIKKRLDHKREIAR
jgi:hypothetical protein